MRSLLLMTVAAVGLGLGVNLPTAGAASPRPWSLNVRPALHTGGLKAPVYGLLDRHHAPSATFSSVVKAYVVTASWADLQPTQNGPLVRPNAIDSAVTYARSRGMTLTLRVDAGISAPEWAKELGGPPITIRYTKATPGVAGNIAGTVGRFWTPAFTAAYASLQVKLAALYDGTPEIRETDVTQCSTIFAETYLRDAADPRNVAALLAAGFTRALDDACHNSQIQAHRVWVRTLSVVSFNPYQWIHSDGTVRPDLAYTQSQMVYCRQVLGRRCVLGNHSLSRSRVSAPGEYATMYSSMKALGAPFAFQTAIMAKIGDLQWVLDWAAADGAASVELPTGYESTSPSSLTSVTTMFQRQATPVPSRHVRPAPVLRHPVRGHGVPNPLAYPGRR